VNFLIKGKFEWLILKKKMCMLCPQGLIKHIKKKLKTKLLLKKNFLSIDIEYTSLKMNFFL
jgi:hypothetical protein